MVEKKHQAFAIIYICLVVILTTGMVILRIQTKKPEVPPIQSVTGDLEITDKIQPLETWYIGQPDQDFKKTTPQPASRGFNYNMFEYYQVEHNKYESSPAGNPRESLFYNIHSKDNGLKVESQILIHGTNFQPDNCGLYSFLESSSTIFIICRDNNTAKNSKGTYQVLGYASSEPGGNYDSRMMNLVLKETIPVMRGDFGAFFEVSMSEVDRQKYYLTTDERLYVIQPDGPGTSLEMKEVPLKFYPVDNIGSGPQPITDSSNGWAIDLIYNQKGNLIVFSGINGGGIIDTTADESLEVDKSCTANISSQQKEEERFYNNRVDPFTEGPYKSINESTGLTNTFEQTVLNAGCVSREGRIRLYRIRDVGFCDIKVKNELLGC